MHSATGLWMARHLHASPTWAPSRVGDSTTKVPIMVTVERVPVADWAVSRGGCGRPHSSAILGFARVLLPKARPSSGTEPCSCASDRRWATGTRLDRAKKTSSPRCLRPRHGARPDLDLHHSRLRTPQPRPPTRPIHLPTAEPRLPGHPRQGRVGTLRWILFTAGDAI